MGLNLVKTLQNIQHHFKDLNEGLYMFEPVWIRQKPKLI